MGLVIQNRHNTISSTLFRSNMKEIDDTPLHKNESEWDLDAMFDSIAIQIRQLTEVLAAISATMATFRTKIEELELRIANLETQRTPQDENDDPEWF